MSTGIKLFSDAANLRAFPYPHSFSAELMFKNATNSSPHIQLIPEKIVESFLNPDGLHFYKVQWQQTWLPEHQFLQYRNIIELFWQSQNDLNENYDDSNISPRNFELTVKATKIDTPHESESFCNSASESKSVNLKNNESFLRALQSDDVDIPQTVITDSFVRKKSTINDLSLGDNSNITVKEPERTCESVVKEPERTCESVVKEPERTCESVNITEDVHELNNSVFSIVNTGTCSKKEFSKCGRESVTTQEDPAAAAGLSGWPQEAKQPDVCKSTENKLQKVLSQRFKNKFRTVQIDGFEIINIENNIASEDELKLKAKEALAKFNGKRTRCPDNSFKLPQPCFFCNKVLCNRKKLREHQFSTHLKNFGQYTCEICQQRFAFRRKLKTHMITHSDKRDFVCEVCGLTCKRKDHLDKHMGTHQEERNYRCDVCHKTFKVQAELKDHCLTEHKDQVNKCNVCKSTLQTGNSVYIHSMRHSGTREHICNVCGASFKREGHLVNHERRIHNSEGKIKCPACEHSLPTKKSFRRHLKIYHKELVDTYRYEYVCNICDQDFAYKGRFDEHMKKHEEETEEERGKYIKYVRSKQVGTLSDEALAELGDKVEKICNEETGEVKLRCKLCKLREFRLISYMEKHLEEHKAGITFANRGYYHKCVVCGKSFNTKSRLLNHKRLHEHESKPPMSYQCKICNLSFKWKTSWLAHVKNCEPKSKGASKRKATLKAKEKIKKIVNENFFDCDEPDCWVESSGEDKDFDNKEELDVTVISDIEIPVKCASE